MNDSIEQIIITFKKIKNKIKLQLIQTFYLVLDLHIIVNITKKIKIMSITYASWVQIASYFQGNQSIHSSHYFWDFQTHEKNHFTTL